MAINSLGPLVAERVTGMTPANGREAYFHVGREISIDGTSSPGLTSILYARQS